MARKKQETLVLFPEVAEITEKLTDAQFGQLMRAAFSYRFQGEVYDGNDPLVDLSFEVLKSQIDRFLENCEKNSNNARSSAKCSETTRNSAESSETQRNPTPIQSNPIQSNPNTNVPGQIVVDSLSDFETFWRAYPKKVGKKAAERAFEKARVPLNTLLDALDRQKDSQQWQRDSGQYIPNPATWLNQGRWEDETPSKPGNIYVPPDSGAFDWMDPQPPEEVSRC